MNTIIAFLVLMFVSLFTASTQNSVEVVIYDYFDIIFNLIREDKGDLEIVEPLALFHECTLELV